MAETVHSTSADRDHVRDQGRGGRRYFGEETVAMKPRITVLTLGVDDLERSLRFYRDGLGLPTEGIIGQEFEYGAVAFFDLQSGLKLALWPRTSIARDTRLPAQPPSATDLTIGHNVNSKEEAARQPFEHGLSADHRIGEVGVRCLGLPLAD